uniref:Uncharacterized protein n=1 Tax=mine drainage metagenome TaxID=410659 RepID=E6PHE8_9ZZZZ
MCRSLQRASIANYHALAAVLRKHGNAVLSVLLKKRKRLHHPAIEPVVGVAQHLASEVRSIFDPAEITARGKRCNLAVAFITT